MKRLFNPMFIILLLAGSLAAQSGTCNGNGTGTPGIDPSLSLIHI